MDLFQENVIVTAANFNVMLVREPWLIDNRIVAKDEIEPGAMFTPALVQFSTQTFSFLLIPDRLQFVPHCDESQKAELVAERLGHFVELLPHTPYTGLGLNFLWHFTPTETKTPQSIGKRMFLKPDTPLATAFGADDARFGGYYSKRHLGFRLKLSAMPIEVKSPELPVREVIQFSFNYHLEAPTADQIRESLSRWSAAKKHSRELASSVEEAL